MEHAATNLDSTGTISHAQNVTPTFALMRPKRSKEYQDQVLPRLLNRATRSVHCFNDNRETDDLLSPLSQSNDLGYNFNRINGLIAHAEMARTASSGLHPNHVLHKGTNNPHLTDFEIDPELIESMYVDV